MVTRSNGIEQASSAVPTPGKGLERAHPALLAFLMALGPVRGFSVTKYESADRWLGMETRLHVDYDDRADPLILNVKGRHFDVWLDTPFTPAEIEAGGGKPAEPERRVVTREEIDTACRKAGLRVIKDANLPANVGVHASSLLAEALSTIRDMANETADMVSSLTVPQGLAVVVGPDKRVLYMGALTGLPPADYFPAGCTMTVSIEDERRFKRHLGAAAVSIPVAVPTSPWKPPQVVTDPMKAEHGVAVADSPLWSDEQRRLARSNHMDYFGKTLGWKD